LKLPLGNLLEGGGETIPGVVEHYSDSAEWLNYPGANLLGNAYIKLLKGFLADGIVDELEAWALNR
jgi:hypothetical protein